MAKTSLVVKQKRPQKYRVRNYTRCNRCGRPWPEARVDAGPPGLRAEGSPAARAGRDGRRDLVHIVWSRHEPNRARARHRRRGRVLHLVRPVEIWRFSTEK